jgi:dTDP-4-amino-4,6-dideoxygalactose transaminase
MMSIQDLYTDPVPTWPIYDASDVQRVTEFCRILSDPAAIGDALFPCGHTETITELRDAIQGYFDVPHAFCVNSGWAAGFAILSALSPTPGDEWIVNSFAHGQSISAFRLFGVKPVFVDPDHTLNLAPERIEAAITERTKGIWLAHVHGNPCQMEAIAEIAARRRLLLVEDCCQSWGARLNGRLTGTYGDFAFFSFCAPKQISSGNGGCVITRNHDAFRRLVLSSGRQGALYKECFGDEMDAREQLRARGYYAPIEIDGTRYFNDTLNYTLDIAPIEAVVTTNRIRTVDERNRWIIHHVGLFKDRLAGVPIRFAGAYKGAAPVYMRLDVHIDFAGLGIDRKAFIQTCKDGGIGGEFDTPPEYLPSVSRLGGAEKRFADGNWLSLTSYKWCTPAATRGVGQIADVLKEALRLCQIQTH